ncbi:unnamed protein product [Camellia sinensis]
MQHPEWTYPSYSRKFDLHGEIPSLSTPFHYVQPAQTTGSFGFGNFGQTQAAGTSGFGGMPSIFGQSTFGQSD